MKVSSATSVGRIRPLNEDAYYVSPPKDSDAVLAVVADGMGGHNAGEVASKKAVRILRQIVPTECDDDHKDVKELLMRAVEDANREIYEMSIRDDGMSGMGTTVTACVAKEGQVTAVQVGDSRLYLIRRNKMTQITKDHSLVEMLIDSGTITKEEARVHPQKNVITRAVGTDKTVEADIYEFATKKSDIILLCSDGLVNMVEDKEILSIIHEEKFDNVADKLVERAENAGGTDNITVILIKF